MQDRFISTILKCTGAEAIAGQETIQRLWSGYGKIERVHLAGGSSKSVVIKHVHWPTEQDHPRGWNTDISHARKVKSYEVESAWYYGWSARCGEACRVPHCLALDSDAEEFLLVLEDLDAAGFSGRRRFVSDAELGAGLSWLAHFHATFMGKSPEGLWETGTYWHVETRPDELDVLKQKDPALSAAAHIIDRRLKESPYQTLVHGDAKLANFCFSSNGCRVAVVDFQYVGGGCGMKDVAYFIGSCLGEAECERREDELLDTYFHFLRTALEKYQSAINAEDAEGDWRELYPVAWTDFHRFLKGWSPGHWKVNDYSERLARKVLANVKDAI